MFLGGQGFVIPAQAGIHSSRRPTRHSLADACSFWVGYRFLSKNAGNWVRFVIFNIFFFGSSPAIRKSAY